MDSFLPSEADLEEAQRTIEERRESLRNATAERVEAEFQSRASRSLARRTATNPVQEKERTEGSLGTVKKLKEELQRRKEELELSISEQRRMKEEYKRLKSIFESFVVDVCEREEAYKVVFAKMHDEIEKHKGTCESLQRQLEEPTSTVTVAATVQAPLAVPTPAVVTVDYRSVHGTIARLRAVMSELESQVGYQVGEEEESPSSFTNLGKYERSKRNVGLAAHNKDIQQQCRQTGQGAQQLEPYSWDGQPKKEPLEVLSSPVVPVAGAGALRGSPGLSASSVVPASRKRKPAKRALAAAVKRPTVKRDGQVRTSSLFTSFSASTERPKGSEVNFGTKPIEDYLGLLGKTELNKVGVLRRELMNFCNSDVDLLATYVVEHFLRTAALTPPMTALWNETVEIMHVDTNFFPLFVRRVVRKLVHFLGPDTAVSAGSALDHSPQLQRLALVLRMACIVQLRETAEGGDALFFAFYESTISALRSWRLSSNAAGQRSVLTLWMVTVRHLYGFVEELHMLIRYYANTDGMLEAMALPKLLTRYTVQAVMTNCYFIRSAQSTPEEMTTDVERWVAFCDSMDWSFRELPTEGIGAAAVDILTHNGDKRSRDEALLSLRLLVLQKGLGFLQSLAERLGAASSDVDVDEAFAELFSLAVVDLQLEDPLDEQWSRAMMFLMDYLYSNSVDQANSVEELLARCKEAHLLALRAVFQLCSGAGALAEERAEHVIKALQWLKAVLVAIDRSACDTSSFTSSPPACVSKAHPFHRTLLGKELAYLCRNEL